MGKSRIERAAERAGAAEARLRAERLMLDAQDPESRLHALLEHSIQVHERAAALHGSAVSLYMRHEALRYYRDHGEHIPAPEPTLMVRDEELR